MVTSYTLPFFILGNSLASLVLKIESDERTKVVLEWVYTDAPCTGLLNLWKLLLEINAVTRIYREETNIILSTLLIMKVRYYHGVSWDLNFLDR